MHSEFLKSWTCELTDCESFVVVAFKTFFCVHSKKPLPCYPFNPVPKFEQIYIRIYKTNVNMHFIQKPRAAVLEPRNEDIADVAWLYYDRKTPTAIKFFLEKIFVFLVCHFICSFENINNQSEYKPKDTRSEGSDRNNHVVNIFFMTSENGWFQNLLLKMSID